MKIIGYARVSKREQSEDSYALKQQQNRLTQAGCDEIFTDIISGTRSDRPQFQRLMQMVRDRAIDKVVITRIDRLGRSLSTVAKSLEDFQLAKVDLQVLDGSVDLSTVGGRTQAGIMSVLAQMESEMTSERSRHGWAYLRSRQVAMNVPFGYRKVDDKHELDPEPFLCLLDGQVELSHAAIARNLIDLFLEKGSLIKTIKAFNQCYGILKFENSTTFKRGYESRWLLQKSPSGLGKWLQSPVLRGHLIYFADTPDRTQTFYDTHPDQRLITDEEFERINQIFAINRERKGFGAIAPVYPLSGLVRCGVCGGLCYSNRASQDAHHRKRYTYYYCKNGYAGACSQKNYFRMDWVEGLLIEALTEKAQAIAQIAATPPDSKEDPRALELRSQLSGLEKLGRNPAIESAKQDILTQIEALQSESRGQSSDQTNLDEVLKTVANKTYWELTSNTEKRYIYRLLVTAIYVKPSDSQPIALTNNKKQARRRHLSWECRIELRV